MFILACVNDVIATVGAVDSAKNPLAGTCVTVYVTLVAALSASVQLRFAVVSVCVAPSASVNPVLATSTGASLIGVIAMAMVCTADAGAIPSLTVYLKLSAVCSLPECT